MILTGFIDDVWARDAKGRRGRDWGKLGERFGASLEEDDACDDPANGDEIYGVAPKGRTGVIASAAIGEAVGGNYKGFVRVARAAVRTAG